MKIPVFFRPEMAINVVLDSPSPRKPHLLMEAWQQLYSNYIDIHTFEPLTRDELYLVHDSVHVDNICNNKRRNGFGIINPQITESLFYTNASFYHAAVWALHHGIAVSPTSGFHHAGYAKAHGFCTFNGLMITAMKLLRDHACSRIGILDCDYHYGDGTVNIIEHYQLHNNIVHVTGGVGYDYDSSTFFKQLEPILEGFQTCDILLYQAGADAHIKDPYGGFLNDLQLRERDKTVFEWAHRQGLPLVWNLAGGYQEDPVTHAIDKVLNIHHATLEECIKAYCGILSV